MTMGSVVRWIARIWSGLSLLFILAFAIGEAGSGPGPSLQMWVGLALFPIGVCLGLALAWYREKLGGLISLTCLLAFYVWNLLRSGHIPRGPWFSLIAAPGLLFLIAGMMRHDRPARQART
jgi:hypothetical protein